MEEKFNSEEMMNKKPNFWGCANTGFFIVLFFGLLCVIAILFLFPDKIVPQPKKEESKELKQAKANLMKDFIIYEKLLKEESK